MEILSEQELAGRLDYRRPLKPEPIPERLSLWCIPFEYGGNAKGTLISISKAKEISAALRADVAEAEQWELMQAFKKEKARADEMSGRIATLERQLSDARVETVALKRSLRKRGAK